MKKVNLFPRYSLMPPKNISSVLVLKLSNCLENDSVKKLNFTPNPSTCLYA